VPTIKDLPLLVDVPVVLPRAGGFVLSFPVAAGDECLVVFSDTNMDAWWQAGGVQNPVDRRRHALADGFAILGPWSQQRRLSSYSATATQLRNEAGTVVVELAANTITVQAPTVNVTASSHVYISGSGHTSIEGKDFLTHTHSGVASGGSTSGPVI
jgi:phage baseplate assembly protein gpV